VVKIPIRRLLERDKYYSIRAGMDVACLHGSARRDPHLFFAHGGRADFRGRNGQLYNFFSMPAFSVNVRTEDATFVVRDGLLSVDGSFFTEMHIAALVGWNVQPAAGMQDGSSRLRSGQKWANLSFWASELGEQNWGWRLVNGTCGGHKFKLGKGGYRRCESLEMEVDMASATFSLANWTVSVQGNKVHGWVSGPRHRLDLAFRAKGQGAARYLPHGIVGQSFSTPTPRFGKVDRYPASGHFVTTAMAEGAIDGVAADYEVASPFDTSFSFSRFNAVVQEPLLDPGPLSLLEASAAETVGQEATRRLDEAPCPPPPEPPPPSPSPPPPSPSPPPPSPSPPPSSPVRPASCDSEHCHNPMMQSPIAVDDPLSCDLFCRTYYYGPDDHACPQCDECCAYLNPMGHDHLHNHTTMKTETVSVNVSVEVEATAFPGSNETATAHASAAASATAVAIAHDQHSHPHAHAPDDHDHGDSAHNHHDHPSDDDEPHPEHHSTPSESQPHPHPHPHRRRSRRER